jgi:hypothetical protein
MGSNFDWTDEIRLGMRILSENRLKSDFFLTCLFAYLFVYLQFVC